MSERPFKISKDKSMPLHIAAMKCLVEWDKMYSMCMDRTNCTGCPFDTILHEGHRMCEAASTYTVMHTIAVSIRPFLEEGLEG